VRRRLDAELVRRGLAESRTQARTLIEAGRVRVGGAPATKAARQVDAGEAVLVEGDGPRFVGRGGEKLEGALKAFALDPSGLRVLDAGASTGGFTDALLQRGAKEVVALDVGHGQLHERLRADPRVVVMERTNLRHVEADELGPFDAVVGDLSFISLTKVADVLACCVVPGGWLVLLVKPQFEAGRREVSRGRGIISDPEEWAGAVERVVGAFAEVGVAIEDVVVSPLRGADGNVEFLVRLRREPVAPAPVPADLRDRVEGALEDAGLASTRSTDGTVAVDGASR
jgi:23S rRNA (cytidine1920-2'-O)/16S rRNA (cytidine1409-2'-O)-methyltransferase